jgi:hypothetical protein
MSNAKVIMTAEEVIKADLLRLQAKCAARRARVAKVVSK